MINSTSLFLEKYNIKNKKVSIGFSTGPDSCALALVLNELKDKFNLKLTLCYFNHGWRKEALNEEEFTKDFAKKIGADFVIDRAQNLEKTEEAAREARYQFFEKLNSDCIFLAHNKNDNVETIVYRIIKGTSIKGIRAIQEKRDIFYRPFLDIEKDEILKFLKEKKQKYMVDSSNDEIKYKRNYIRHKILPLFEKVNPNYLNSISNFSNMCTQAQKIIDDKINELEIDMIKDGIINKNKYKNLDISYRLEILNDYLGQKLKYRDYKTIKKLDDFIMNNVTSTTSLNSTEFLKVRKNKIYISTEKGYEI